MYKKFTDNYAAKNPEQLKIALDAAKEFIKKYSQVEEDKNIIEYLKKWIPATEKQIATETQK